MNFFSKMQPLRIWAVVSSLLLMAGIAISSMRPSPKVAGISQSFIDHVLDFAHFPVYMVLAGLLALAFNSKSWWVEVFAFVAAAGWGIINEFIQLHTPGRSYEVKDMLVNALGAVLALILFRYFSLR